MASIIIGLLGGFAIDGISSGAASLFDWVMGLLYSIITADWGVLDGNNVANLIYRINREGMVPIGVALVSAFILAHMCKTSASFMEFKRPSMFIRAALKLVLADAAVIMSYPLFRELYDLFAAIIRQLFTVAGYADSSGFTGIIVGDSTTFAIDGFATFLAFILVLICFVSMLVTCFSVLLTVMGRFFKIYLYAMIAPIPLSTLACEGPDRIGKSFALSFVSVCLEGLVIAGAGIVFATYLRSGDFLRLNNGTNVLAQALSFLSEDGAQVVANQIGMLLNMSIFAGMVKGSDRIVREIVG